MCRIQMALEEVGRIAGRAPVLREGLVTFPELAAANRRVGDAGGDGDVNIADFNILAGDFGCAG